MAEIPIRIPKVSTAAFDAVLVSFLVPDGESVASGEPLFAVGTDKVDTEVPSAASGVVRWTADLGETYEVGTQVGYIEATE